MNNPLTYEADPLIEQLIKAEETRQEQEITLIASENYAPPLIRTILSSTLTNKYAEGYPGKRYYAGCRFVDEIETIAIERAKKLFGAEHANVQPHSGSQANMALYATLLNPGDTIMGMSLAAGGHLTHGHGVNFSGVFYKSVQYGVDPQTELINYNEIATLAEQHKPKLIMAGASAYSRIIDFARIKAIADHVGAFFTADIAHIAGLIAAGLHPSPVPFADIVSSTTHKTLRGPRGGFLLSRNTYQDRIDRAVLPGVQGGPLMHIIAAKATTFEYASAPDFADYQKRVITHSKLMAQLFQERGYRVITGGTDNHLFQLDLRSHKINGRAAERLLESVGITVSRSCIPFDTEKPWLGSGIRLGTPAITTRGMDETEVHQIVELIDDMITHPSDDLVAKRVATQVQKLCKEFPIYVGKTSKDLP